MSGIISYGSYIPYWRLQRAAISGALGTHSGKGTRSVASYDEDPTSMGVEAARMALSALGGTSTRAVYFATTRPSYLEKTNATAIHAALDLDEDAFAADMIGSVRSGVAAIRAALDAPKPTLAVLSDIRTGLAGGSDEREGGDGAAALLCAAEGDFIAECLGGATATAEFLDRWRAPGDFAARVWEERFGESIYLPLARSAIASALKQAEIAPEQVTHFIVTGTHSRSIPRIAATVKPETLVDNLAATIGNTGCAHPGILLASVLDSAGPEETIALVVLADGADVLLFRTTKALTTRRQPMSVASQMACTRDDLAYSKFQTWRGVYRLEPPRRPDPVGPQAPPTYRSEKWKFAFTGTRCAACGTCHLPPARICLRCGAVDKMLPERLANTRASVATFTIDRLAYSKSPPVVVGVLDFDGGGRIPVELTDVDPGKVQVGDRVEMTFRRMYAAGSVQNYFWKARPIRGTE
ncbi:MAG: OB-fold domain-containing protein [Acidimicrobiales bacterium]|jgi:hydroxymethylglutaryl-CoA synthase